MFVCFHQQLSPVKGATEKNYPHFCDIASCNQRVGALFVPVLVAYIFDRKILVLAEQTSEDHSTFTQKKSEKSVIVLAATHLLVTLFTLLLCKLYT